MIIKYYLSKIIRDTRDDEIDSFMPEVLIELEKLYKNPDYFTIGCSGEVVSGRSHYKKLDGKKGATRQEKEALFADSWSISAIDASIAVHKYLNNIGFKVVKGLNVEEDAKTLSVRNKLDKKDPILKDDFIRRFNVNIS